MLLGLKNSKICCWKFLIFQVLSLCIEFQKMYNFPWTCSFLTKNLSKFVFPSSKFRNLYDFEKISKRIWKSRAINKSNTDHLVIRRFHCQFSMLLHLKLYCTIDIPILLIQNKVPILQSLLWQLGPVECITQLYEHIIYQHFLCRFFQNMISLFVKVRGLKYWTQLTRMCSV